MGLRLLVPSGAFTVSHNGIVHWRCRCRARCAQRYVDTIGKTHTHKIGKWTAKKNQPPQPYPTQVRAAAGGDLSEFPISPLLPHMTSGLPAPSHPAALCTHILKANTMGLVHVSNLEPSIGDVSTCLYTYHMLKHNLVGIS